MPLEAHLMITNPEEYIEDFARAGADVIIFHQEVTPHIHRVIQQNCGLVPFAKTELTLASLGPDTALIGAARVWHHRFGRVGGEYAS